MRIDEEQRQDLPMAKFGLVEQLKRFNTVLKDVRECEETAFSGDDVSRILHSRTVLFTLVDILEAVMVVLLINDVLPSLFPVVYGRTKILRDSLVGLDDRVEKCGEGDTLTVPPSDEAGLVTVYESRASEFWNWEAMQNPYSRKFQWLPCEVGLEGCKVK